MKVYNTGAGEKAVQELTPDFLQKLTDFAESFRKMMRESDSYPNHWGYAEVRISDLGFTGGIKFSFGSLEDLPEHFPADFKSQEVKVLIRSKFEIENKGENDAI